MAPRWRYPGACLAAACAVCVCVTFASAAEAVFEYTIQPLREVEPEGSSAIEPADPALCGTDLGWIETLTSEFEAEAVDELVPVGKSVWVSKGPSWVSKGPRGLSRELTSAEKFAPRQVRFPASLEVHYTGCVVPSGRVLVSLAVDVSFDAHDGPRRFAVTYDGPPLQTWRGRGRMVLRAYGCRTNLLGDALLKSFTVETDIGSATLSDIGLSWWPWLSARQHAHFWTCLRLESAGGAQ